MEPSPGALVRGLAGGGLPPRPSRKPSLQLHVPCLARVQSNSHLVLPPVAGAACPPVDTPSGEPPLPHASASDGQQPQPASSDQSNVRGAGPTQDMQRGCPGEVQSPDPVTAQQLAGGTRAPSTHPRGPHAAVHQQPQQSQALQQQIATPFGAPAAQAATPWDASGQKRSTASLHGVEVQGAGGSAQQGRRRRSRAPSGTTPAPDPAVSAGGGAKRSRSTTPAAKRQRSSSVADRGGGAGGYGGGGKYADVLHRTVEVPGAIFYVDEPGMYYVGRVNKSEGGRKVPSVEVQFLDDSSKYWFPLADVRAWMLDMQRRGTWSLHNPGAPPPSMCGVAAVAAAAAAIQESEERAAAEALQSLSATVSLTSSRRVEQGADGQPAVSSQAAPGEHPEYAAHEYARQAVERATTAAAAAGGGSRQRGHRGSVSGGAMQSGGALDAMAVLAGLRSAANSPTR